MKIGNPKRTITIVPNSEPVPMPLPKFPAPPKIVPEPVPAKVPARASEREKALVR